MEHSRATITPRLGHYLPCSPRAIASALRRQASISTHPLNKRLGKILIEGKLISPQDLRAGIEAQRVDRLQGCSLFNGFPREDLVRLTAAFEEVTIEDGEVFITQGSNETHLYVLVSGKLEVFRTDRDGEEAPLATISAGEPVGEMGYLFGGLRTASVRTIGLCQLLRASYHDLQQLLNEPRLAYAILVVVTRRLFDTNLLYQKQHHRLLHVEQSLHQLRDFLDLSEMTALGSGIEDLIDRLVHTVSNLTDADRASLFLIDPVSGDLWSKIAEGLEIQEISVPAGRGVIGWVAEHRELLNIPNAYADDRFLQEVDRHTGYHTRSILCAPIWSLNNEILGVVQVINKRNGPFNAHDETMIRAFAYQAAIAVENFNLYSKLMINYRRMAVLLDVANSISETLELQTLIRKIVSRTAYALECDGCSFFVVDENAHELWSMHTHGAELKEIRFPMSTGLAGYSASTGEVLNVRDAYEDDRFNREIDRRTGYRTRDVLCVPVVNREGKITSVIECLNKRDGTFDDNDVQLLRAIASQVSVALDNAQLHAGAVDMRNYLDSVQQSIASCILTLDQNYHVVMANRAAENLFLGMGLGGPERDVRKLLGSINMGICQVIEDGYEKRTLITRYDINLRRSVGDVSTVNVSVLPLNDSEDTFKGLVLVIEDITNEKRVRSAFNHYLAPAVIDQILADPKNLSLGGVQREITALFTDIENFTSLSEDLDAEDLVHLLNEYFDQVCGVVLRHNGTIDKIVGDSLHVLFNAPVDQADHTVRAIRCALEIDECCRALMSRQTKRGLALGQTRIGVNTGTAIVGNFGGITRFDYTAHGDAINTASRLEGANKYLGTRICVSQSTKAQCTDMTFRPVGQLLLKGKNQTISVYEPLASSAMSKACLAAYVEAYELMARGEARAAEAFDELASRYPEDGLINFHARRLGAGETGIRVEIADK